MRIGSRVLIVIMAFILSSCSEDISYVAKVRTYKVAVVMPGDRQEEWSRTAKWVLDNLHEAQRGLSGEVKLSLQWFDENSPDIDVHLKNISNDDSYVAIIGPYSSAKARTAAGFCARSGKTLILPIATSAEVQRIYASVDNIWNLTQSDISQCEMMLAQAKLSESDKVSLIVSDDDYGRSFSDWFAYQAEELGLSVKGTFICSSEEEIRSAVNAISENFKYGEHLLLALSQENLILAFDAEIGRLAEETSKFRFPYLICSDVVNSPTLAPQLKNITYEGLSPSAAPSSGFAAAYNVKYGCEPSNGEAHLYDAISLLALALTVDSENPDNGILELIKGRETWNGSWLSTDMHDVFARLQAGGRPDVSGVTGDWTFDERHHSSVLNTTYSHWILRDGQYFTLEYLSADGGSRTTSTLQAWDVQRQEYQQFSSAQRDRKYPEHSGENWAIVIGTSDKWAYYRHQADALAMYQLLKRHGYKDDHIILIIADNIAYDSHNIYPGVVRVRPDGENVYEDVVVDYKIDEIKITDLKAVMTGQRSERHPEVIVPDGNDNVVVFWCGHGAKKCLMWGSNDVVYGYQIADIIQSMTYRKMLWSMDACYSGTIGEACEGIPGVLFITAANANETSKADMKDPEMGIWLSNGFTRSFQETIDDNPNITMRDLYYNVARHTIGSHATVYNHTMYGNMFTNTMQEYLK